MWSIIPLELVPKPSTSEQELDIPTWTVRRVQWGGLVSSRGVVMKKLEVMLSGKAYGTQGKLALGKAWGTGSMIGILEFVRDVAQGRLIASQKA